MIGCMDGQEHRVPAGLNFCTRCGFVMGKAHLDEIKDRARKTKEKRAAQASKRAKKTRTIAYAQGNLCFYCEVAFGKERAPTFDHFIPRARGGAGEVTNGVAACYSCNHKKSDMLPLEFMASNRAPVVFRLRAFVAMVAMFRSC